MSGRQRSCHRALRRSGAVRGREYALSGSRDSGGWSLLPVFFSAAAVAAPILLLSVALSSCGELTGGERGSEQSRALARLLGPHAAVFHDFERARVVEVEVLPAGTTVDRGPGSLERYLGPYRVTATSGLLPEALVSRARAALRDPGAFVLTAHAPVPRGFARRCLILEAGERALTVGLLVEESMILVGVAQPRGRGRVVLRLSEVGRATLASLVEVPLAPTGR